MFNVADQIFGNIGRGIGGAISSGVNTIGNWLTANDPVIKYGGGTPSKPQGATKNPANTANDAWASQAASYEARIRALQAQAAQAPRLPNFDIMANYNQAKSQATAAVTPLYNKKLNIFLEGQGIKKDTKTKETNLARENNQIALNQALQDNSTTRTRTGEDLSSALAQIGQTRNDFLVDDARQFDAERRALMEETAAGGATDTGLGQQAIGQQQDDRNTMASRQTREFKDQEAAKKQLATRTFDDLITSDKRTGEKKTQDDKAVQIDFDSYMASLANEETGFRLQNDLDMALDISRQTQSYADQGTQSWLASLASGGWRAQDIALASQVYR